MRIITETQNMIRWLDDSFDPIHFFIGVRRVLPIRFTPGGFFHNRFLMRESLKSNRLRDNSRYLNFLFLQKEIVASNVH